MVTSRIMLSATVTALLIGSVLTATFAIQSANASGTIYIRANGLVEGTTEITSADNITYTFTVNIFDSIVIERSNITVDGRGYTLWGPRSGRGFYWSGINNVTVTNVGIGYFNLGIQVGNSSLNTISGNNITNNDCGIVLSSSSNNSVSGNNIVNNLRGIQIHSSSNNSISGNNIAANTEHGIDLDSSSNSNISENNITANNRHGIELTSGSNNSISGNNITANRRGGVSLAHSSNNSVRGNNITANNVIGVEFGWGSNNNSVNGNNITANNGRGIVLDSSSNNSVNGNNVTANSYAGIRLYSSSDNSVNGNNVTANNDAGIHLYSSSNNSVGENSFVNNGLISESSYGNVVSNNLVNGKPLVYLEDTSDIVVEQAGQVVLVRCDHIGVENMTLSNASVGVQMWQTNNTEILGNNMTNNVGGVWLHGSSNNSVRGNNITANNVYGIYIHDSSNNSVSENSITNNGRGVWLYDSSNNSIYHNNFVGNAQQVYVARTGYPNYWDDGYPSGGNYWGDYSDLDSNKDGLGDAPYQIDANNTDNYPLMGMFSSFATALQKHVNVVSNSTIDDFSYLSGKSTIRMHVSNMTANQTYGFARMRIPHALMNETYQVTIDGAEPYYVNYTLYDDGENRWIYFSYKHSPLEIIIIPEFPVTTILPLLITLSLLAFSTIRKLALMGPLESSRSQLDNARALHAKVFPKVRTTSLALVAKASISSRGRCKLVVNISACMNGPVFVCSFFR